MQGSILVNFQTFAGEPVSAISKLNTVIRQLLKFPRRDSGWFKRRSVGTSPWSLSWVRCASRWAADLFTSVLISTDWTLPFARALVRNPTMKIWNVQFNYEVTLVFRVKFQSLCLKKMSKYFLMTAPRKDRKGLFSAMLHTLQLCRDWADF